MSTVKNPTPDKRIDRVGVSGRCRVGDTFPEQLGTQISRMIPRKSVNGCRVCRVFRTGRSSLIGNRGTGEARRAYVRRMRGNPAPGTRGRGGVR